MTTFEALGTHEYLIRLGTYPGSAGGAGTFSISCGPPNVPACTGATGDCCVDHAPGNRLRERTLLRVGVRLRRLLLHGGMGQQLRHGGREPQLRRGSLCPQLCGPNCPLGTVSFVDPAAGAVDAAFVRSAYGDAAAGRGHDLRERSAGGRSSSVGACARPQVPEPPTPSPE